MSSSEVYGTLAWERRDAGIADRKAPLAYFNDEYRFAIFPGAGRWDLCWAAPDSGYEMLEQGLTVAEAKRCAEREVAGGRVRRVS